MDFLKKTVKNIGGHNKTLIVLGLILALAVITLIVYSNNNHQDKITRLTNNANKAAFDGNFDETIKIRKQLYATTPDQIRKAEIANEIASSYIAIKDIDNAQYWAKISVNIYTKAGAVEQAQNVKASIESDVTQLKEAGKLPTKPSGGSDGALE